jgi:hypothetical protein
MGQGQSRYVGLPLPSSDAAPAEASMRNGTPRREQRPEQPRDEQGAWRWAVPHVLATRLATVALWVLVVTGALAGFAALARGSGAAPAPAPVQLANQSAGPEGVAELYVAAWLDAGEGEEDALEALYPDVPALRQVEAGARYAARTATVAAEELGGGYWSVTVAAEVLVAVEASAEDDPGAAGYRRDGTHYYRVGVLQADGGYVATGLPGEVPAPPLAKAAKVAGPGLERPEPDDPIATAVRQFLVAYLAGEGEIERYTSPGAAVQAVDPVPFVGVELTRLAQLEAAGSEAPTVVRAEASATTSDGGVQVLHYALELAERQGRWEVGRVLPAAPLRAAPSKSTTDTGGT